MKLIGSKFTEIKANRNPDFSGKLQLKTNIKIDSIEKTEKSKDTLKIKYTFEVDYVELGKISLKGELYTLTDSKTIKNVLKSKENKEYSSNEYIFITNLVMNKASIKAFELEEELGLPIHIKLPTISTKKE